METLRTGRWLSESESDSFPLYRKSSEHAAAVTNCNYDCLEPPSNASRILYTVSLVVWLAPMPG